MIRVVADMANATDWLCQRAPDAFRAIGINAVLGDQMEPAAGLVADYLGLPFVSIAAALPMEPDPIAPLPVLPFGFDPSPAGERRNAAGAAVVRFVMREHAHAIARNAARFGLGDRRDLARCFSRVATVSQMVPGFDLPRRMPLARHHGVGPIRLEYVRRVFSPSWADSGRAVAFVSLGTMQGGRLGLFRRIASACRRLGLYTVLAHCGELTPRQAATLPADIVTDFVPQRAVLAMADVVVTHAGLNTALDALSFGVPMLALPIAFDQPGVAARIVHHGAGLSLDHRIATSRAIERAIARLIIEPAFRTCARAIGAEIAMAGGAERAADVIEHAAGAVMTGRHVA
jgi:zeaxanthin glucosyltransferase